MTRTILRYLKALSFGFITINEIPPHPICVVYHELQANEAMVLSKLKRHLQSRHFHFSEKLLEYFNQM